MLGGCPVSVKANPTILSEDFGFEDMANSTIPSWLTTHLQRFEVAVQESREDHNHTSWQTPTPVFSVLTMPAVDIPQTIKAEEDEARGGYVRDTDLYGSAVYRSLAITFP